MMEKLIRIKKYYKAVRHDIFVDYGANDLRQIICISTGELCEIVVIFGNLQYEKLEDEPGQYVLITTDRFVYQYWQGASIEMVIMMMIVLVI